MNSRQIITAPAGYQRSLAMAAPDLMMASDRLDLSGTVSFFRRRLGLIIAIVGLAIVLGAVITWTRPTLYSAKSVVSIETPKEEIEGAVKSNTSATPTDGFVDTQVQIIESRQLARQVATDLGFLTGKDEEQQRAIIDHLQNNVAAYRRGESYTLEIAVTSQRAAKAAQVANEYARQFGNWEQRSERERKKKRTEQLAERLQQLRTQAYADTEKLQRFRIANNLLSTSGASLTEQEISGYNQAVTQARAEAAQDQARLETARNQLRSGSTGEDVGEALDSPVISSLRSRQAQIGGEAANLRSRYGPNHPQRIRAAGELREIDRQISAEIERILSNLQAKKRVSEQRLASLVASLAGAREKLSQNNEAMVGLIELERQAQASQGLYEAYLNSYKKLLANEDLEQPNSRVLSTAVVPDYPSSPNVKMNLVLSVVIGIGLAFLAAIVAESLFNGLTSSDEVEQKLGVRFLGSIPLLESVSKMREVVPAIREDPWSPFTESFRSLRTSIEHAVHGSAQVIAITSALPGEGKTAISACLAQTLAMGGSKTLLIDCDWARRGTSGLLQLDGDYPGLVEVLEGSATLADALISGETSLSVLPIRPSRADREALLIGRGFDQLIQDLRSHFDYVVLDLPPVLPIAATRIMAGRADATVLTVRWRKTAIAAVRTALSQLPGDRVNLAGVALSHVDMRRARQFGTHHPAQYNIATKECYQ